MKLNVKLVAAFLLTALIPVCVLGYLSYHTARQALKKQAIEDLVLVAEAKEGHLYSFLESIKGRALDFSSDGFIRDKVKRLYTLNKKNIHSPKTQKLLSAHLRRNKKSLDETIRCVCVIDINGRIIGSCDENKIDRNESGKEYFVQGMKNIYVSDVYALHDGKTLEPDGWGIAVSAPMTDKNTGDILGVIVNYYDTTVLNKILSGEFQLGKGALSGTKARRETLDIYLVNRDGVLITPARFGGEVMKRKVESLPVLEGAAGRETKGVYTNYRGEVIGASMFFPLNNWLLLVEMDTNEAFYPIKKLKNRLIVMTIPIMVLAFFLAYFLSRESQGAIRESEERFRLFMNNSQAVAFLKDTEGRHVYVNEQFLLSFNKKLQDVIGKTDFDLWPKEIAENLRENDKKILFERKSMEVCEAVPTADGVLHDWLVCKFPVKDRRGVWFLGGVALDITGQKQSEEQLRKLSHAVEQSSSTVVITDAQGRIEYVNPKFTQLTNYTAEEAKGKNPRILKSGRTPPEEYAKLWETISSGKEWHGEFCNIKKNGELYWESASISPVKNTAGEITHFIAIKDDITERKQAERRLEVQHTITAILAESFSFEDTTTRILQTICEGLGWDIGEFWMVDQKRKALRCVEIWNVPTIDIYEFKTVTKKVFFTWGRGLPGRIWAEAKPSWVPDIVCEKDFFLKVMIADKEGIRGSFGFPVINENEVLGVMVFLSRQIKQPDDALVDMVTAIGGQIGIFVRRKHAEELTQLQIKRLSALHEIDMAIAGAFDMNVSLGVFLDKVITSLDVDAANILLLNKHTQMLEYIAGRGFLTNAIQRTSIRLGAGSVGGAILENRHIFIPDLRNTEETLFTERHLTGENFLGYCAKPLIVRGQINGVLEIFNRTPLGSDEDWLNFFDVLSGQGALLIDSALMLHDLQRSHTELAVAYDGTIEGWARALDLRDRETEGHSRRVTEMTLRLAKKMGIKDDKLVHVRRGALLHDIGKVGIPDNILLKAGTLTEEEWKIMREHPTYAYAMLFPIAYLRSALDIPYCHHEKWDGTGYPKGLKGDRIPLSARIFAVVDVWDALCSDRPYRRGWAKDKVREYIRSQAGIHFDPQVVKAFLEEEV